jgi:hypothetical protein
LALATYKSKDPDPVTALQDADHILREKLQAETTNDPETLGLFGAVHKRLWELGRDRKNLDTAIAAYERGFYLRQDYYHGINLAFLANVRAVEHQAAGHIAEAIADFVLARRIRRDVILICEQALAVGPRAPDDTYWILATLWEAAYGLEDPVAVAKWQPEAEKAATARWMLENTRLQIEKLEKLLTASPRNILLSKRVGGGIIYDEDFKLGVTSDGPGGSTAEDPAYQLQTTLKYVDGRSVNSRIVPYIALPKINLASDKVKAGDNVIVFNTSNGRQAFAVIGDIAPNRNAIDISVALANSLGIHFDLKKGVGTDKIICLVFPASGSGYCPEPPAAIDEQGRTLFKAWLVSLR